MKKLIVFIILLAMCQLTLALEFSTPEKEGVSSQAILEFINAAEAQVDALHSFMLVRHGKIVAQGWWSPYQQQSPHMLYSLSKSFTSTAVGLAISEKLLTLNDTVISFFPDQLPDSVSNNLKAMRIRDLLAMNSGHRNDTTGPMTSVGGESWVKAFLALDVEFKPGTHFVYNSGATFMLSAIVQKVTGQTVLEYLTPRLFEPLGIENPTWEENPQGINMGGWGLKVKTEDIAKFGQLYLQKGMWQGKRILEESWIDTAASRQTSNGSNPNSDWEQGYGYQFWRCRHNFFRGDGAFGQYCIVMPEMDAVLAITSGVGDMQTPMNLVWDILVPAMKELPLAENPQALIAMNEKINSLELLTVDGESSAKMARKISGKTYTFQKNEAGFKSIKFKHSKKQMHIQIDTNDGLREIKSTFGSWQNGELPFESSTPEPMAACGAWIDSETYQLKLAHTETPYIETIHFTFKDKKVKVDRELNVAFGKRTMKTLTATR